MSFTATVSLESVASVYTFRSDSGDPDATISAVLRPVEVSVGTFLAVLAGIKSFAQAGMGQVGRGGLSPVDDGFLDQVKFEGSRLSMRFESGGLTAKLSYRPSLGVVRISPREAAVVKWRAFLRYVSCLERFSEAMRSSVE